MEKNNTMVEYLVKTVMALQKIDQYKLTASNTDKNILSELLQQMELGKLEDLFSQKGYYLPK